MVILYQKHPFLSIILLQHARAIQFSDRRELRFPTSSVGASCARDTQRGYEIFYLGCTLFH